MAARPPARVRVIVAPCRSATTALLRLFAQHPDVHCVYQPVKTGLRASGIPDYGIYHERHPVFEERPRFVVSKETVGHSSATECSFHPLENDAVIRRVRPLFIFRNPTRTWNSWKRLRWGSLELFVATFRYVHALMMHARSISPDTRAMTAESLSERRCEALQQVCTSWGLPAAQALFGEFDKGLFESRRVYVDDAARRYSQTQGSHEILMRSTTFALPSDQEDVTSIEERALIRGELDPLYASVRAGEWPGAPAEHLERPEVASTHAQRA